MAKKTEMKGRTASGNGKSPEQLVRQNSQWRDSYNPLRALVMSRVVSLLEAGERGEFADLQWLFRMVEKRYAVLRSLIARRRAAISKLEIDVRIKPMDDDPGKGKESDPQVKALQKMAEAQRQWLLGRYKKIENLTQAVRFLALAEFRGYSILQKHRNDPDDASVVTELHWLPQWNWVRDGLFGDWHWNANAQSASALTLGEANRIGGGLAREDFIIRDVEMPIDELGAIAFVRSNLSQKDWDAFVEMFGLPGCIVIMPANIPSGKEGEYESAAQAVAEGGSGALPATADAKFPSASTRGGGGAPFKEHMEQQEKDVVLAGTGGKLTMLTGPTGLGGQQAEVHEDVFDELATAEAGEISEVLRSQFDAQELAMAFPGQPVLVEVYLKPVDKSADEKIKFKREVFGRWQTDGTVSDVLANQTDLKQLVREVDLPVNEEYVDPYLPVTDANGNAVTGDVVEDKEGDVIGAVVKQTGINGTDVTDGNTDTHGPARTDTRLKAEDDQVQKPEEKKPVKNRGAQPNGAQNPRQAVAMAVARDLAPVRERLQRILAIQDPEMMRQKLQALRGELEQLKADVAADPESARAIEQVLVDGMGKGLTRE